MKMVLCRKFIRLGRRIKLIKFFVLLFVIIFCASLWLKLSVRRRESNELSLGHFRKDRNLSDYINSIHLIAEPSSTPCDGYGDVPLLILVTSTSTHYERRDALRATWAKHFPTYFMLGVTTQLGDVENINLEVMQYNDMIVYDMMDHYQNLTLKTALMLKWTHSRCPSIDFMLKTDDDVMVNPWIMRNVLKENKNSKLLGDKQYNVWAIRDEYEKWYLPSWLFPQRVVPEYLSGPAYLINGKYTKIILDAAEGVPLINIEDIYFSYLVSRAKLGLELTHDPRMSSTHSYHFLLPCLYWPYAITHNLRAQDIIKLWPGIVTIAKNNGEDCANFSRFFPFFYSPAATMFAVR